MNGPVIGLYAILTFASIVISHQDCQKKYCMDYGNYCEKEFIINNYKNI